METNLLTTPEAARAIVERTVSQPETPTEVLIRLALDKGQSPTELYAILKEERSLRAVAAFARSFAAFQGECPLIPKDGLVDYTSKSGIRTKYTFAPLDTIAAAIRPLLAKHGFSYGWDSDVQGNRLKCTCTLRHEAGHRETATIDLPTESVSPGMGPQQQVASALTFAMRQTLRSVLGLTATDPDNELLGDGPGGVITEDQRHTLNDLLIQTDSDKTKFLAWCGAATLADVPAAKFEAACRMLNAKLAKAKA